MFQSREIYFLRTQSNIALTNAFLIGFVDNPRISKAHSWWGKIYIKSLILNTHDCENDFLMEILLF